MGSSPTKIPRHKASELQREAHQRRKWVVSEGATRIESPFDALGPTGGLALANHLGKYSALRRIDLAGNGICGNDWSQDGYDDSRSFVVLVTALSDLPLAEIDLAANGVDHRTTAGAEALARLVANSKTLQTLDLSHNSLGFTGGEGAVALFEAIAGTVAPLMALSCAANHLGHWDAAQVGAALASAISQCPTLTHLDLASNSLCGVRRPWGLGKRWWAKNALLSARRGSGDRGGP